MYFYWSVLLLIQVVSCPIRIYFGPNSAMHDWFVCWRPILCWFVDPCSYYMYALWTVHLRHTTYICAYKLSFLVTFMNILLCRYVVSLVMAIHHMMASSDLICMMFGAIMLPVYWSLITSTWSHANCLPIYLCLECLLSICLFPHHVYYHDFSFILISPLCILS